MKAIKLGEKCIPLDDIPDPKSLSNRVCYDSNGLGLKRDEDGCDFCQKTDTYTFADPDPLDAEPTCNCAVDSESQGSFKCGKDIYVCEDYEDEISTALVKLDRFKYFKIDHSQCAAMKLKQLGDACVQLPQYNLYDVSNLGQRVCYGDGHAQRTFVKDGELMCGTTRVTETVDDWWETPKEDSSESAGPWGTFRRLLRA